MGRALEVLTGRITNQTALTPVTLATGDSLTVRFAPTEAGVFLASVWYQGATDGTIRIRSPRLHDNAQGIRLRADSGFPMRPLIPPGLLQSLYPQDTLTVEAAGGGAETDVVALLVYYLDLPGADARLATWQEVAPRVRNIHGAEQSLTTGSTVGDYGGGQVLTADFDSFKRNVDYAVLGYTTDVPVGVVGIRGADTANLRVAGPGSGDAEMTAGWFKTLSDATGLPCIPVVNAANAQATTIDVVHTAANAAVNITLVLAELGG